MEKATFVFTPSHMQQDLLERVLDSIVRHISIPCHFCLFTDRLNEGFSSKYEIEIKEISDKDLTRLNELYFKEGRADIPAFAAYAQFLIPRYFANQKSYIYMEVDQIVCGDLAQLWRHCEDGNLRLAAVPSHNHKFEPSAVQSFRRMCGNETYFNTGVLYVNSEYWNSEGLESVCFEEAALQKKENGRRYDFYAQGAINNSLHKLISEIPLIYNVTGLGHVRGLDQEILNKAIILHWTGPLKPWKKDGLYRDIYYDDPSLRNALDYKDISLFKSLLLTAYGNLRNLLLEVRYKMARIFLRSD